MIKYSSEGVNFHLNQYVSKNVILIWCSTRILDQIKFWKGLSLRIISQHLALG